ncbi:M48 family metallopeptidase [Nocardia sp. NPDC050175]|uniref:M48 family metallopeptidase n=1 Tax=Nocardia sp. NPDC050175 TaxID=3364317 RepID=UPI003794CCE8
MQPHEPQPHQTGQHVDPYASAGWAQPQDASYGSQQPYGSPPPYPAPPQYGPYPGAPVPPPLPPQQQPRGLSPFGMPARHSWEIPMLIVVVLLTVLAYAIAVLLLATGNFDQYVLLLVFAPILIWLGRGVLYSTQRVNGVKMSPTQFPEGHRLVVEAAARFGMAKVPDAYVVLGNGQINAFASGHGFRRFVAVYSDLFEIGGAAREPDALAFIIGHEVGHIAAGHASYWRQLGMFLVPFLPFIGNSLIRAQEYTADNHGYCNRHTGAPAAMGTLAAGKYLNTLVGFDEMADRAAMEKGFFVWVVNAMSSHPVLTWRMWALRDRSRHGKLWLRPAPPAGAMPPQGYPGSYQTPALPPKTVP